MDPKITTAPSRKSMMLPCDNEGAIHHLDLIVKLTRQKRFGQNDTFDKRSLFLVVSSIVLLLLFLHFATVFDYQFAFIQYVIPKSLSER
jgi:hypothetical protein